MGKAPKVNVPEEHPKAKFHLGTFTAPPPLCLVTLICSAVSMLTCDHSSSCCVLLPASSHRCACLCPERHVQVEEGSGPACARQAILERHVEARELEGFPGVSPCAIFRFLSVCMRPVRTLFFPRVRHDHRRNMQNHGTAKVFVGKQGQANPICRQDPVQDFMPAGQEEERLHVERLSP